MRLFFWTCTQVKGPMIVCVSPFLCSQLCSEFTNGFFSDFVAWCWRTLKIIEKRGTKTLEEILVSPVLGKKDPNRGFRCIYLKFCCGQIQKNQFGRLKKMPKTVHDSSFLVTLKLFVVNWKDKQINSYIFRWVIFRGFRLSKHSSLGTNYGGASILSKLLISGYPNNL